MPHLLILWIFTAFCIIGCIPSIYKNDFYHVGSVIWSLDSSVYQEFILTRKGNPRLLCGAKCGTVDKCRGMEVCDGRLCRLWNETFTLNTTGNTSTKTCRRYSKVDLTIVNSFVKILLYYKSTVLYICMYI